MSKPFIFSVLAMVCYSIANVLLEQKFTKYNNLTIICVYTLVVLFVAIVGRALTKTSDPSFDFPVGMNLVILIGLGLIIATADYLYIGAYTNGGDLLTVTSIIALFPVFSSLIKFVLTRGIPNVWQMSGYLLAFGAVVLVAKGSTA